MCAIGETPLRPANQAFDDFFRGRFDWWSGGGRIAAQQPILHRGISEGNQPVGRLHHVAVGVVEDAPGGVRHLGSSLLLTFTL